MANPSEFTKQYGAIAKAAGDRLKIDPQILLGQWGLETGWGKSVVPGTNNLGNIKDFTGGGVGATDNITGSRDNYRQFDTPEAFADHFSGLIERKYPDAIGAGEDAAKFAQALKAGGYAEDPAYIRKVVNVTNTVRKTPGVLDMLAAAVFPAAQAGTLPTKKPPLDMSQVKFLDAPPDSKPKLDMSQVKWLDGPAGQGVGRQLGLTARAALSGASAIPNALWNGPVGVINALAGTEIPKADSGATADWLGLPQPENGVERVAQDVAGGMVGAGGVAKLAQAGTKALNPVVQSVAKALGLAPGTQVASAAAGSAGAGGAREAGAGPGVQITAGLATGAGPALLGAGLRQLPRVALGATGEGRQKMADNIALFSKAGTSPTVGQATEGRLAQALESTLSRTPGGAGVINRKATAQTGEIARNVDDIVNRLSPNAGAVEAGESITKGLEGFKAGVKAQQARLYSKLDEFLPAKTPITVNRTKEALEALNSDIEGAPALSAMFKNGKIQGIERALLSDLKVEAKPYGHRMAGEPARPVPTLPYESIKKLRTLVGKEIDNANFTSDVPRDKWRAFYGALTEDLGDAARAAGPQARDAWAWANTYSKTQLNRLDELSLVAGKDAPEKVFQAALQGSSDGDTVLRRVINSVPKQNRKDLAAAVLKRMGKATAGNQDETGEAFSIGTFLTNWAKMSPPARLALFGRTGDAGLLDDLANLAGVASNIREGSKVFANPSGTSGAAAANVLTTGGIVSALTGNVPALTGIVAAPASANVVAKLMANPKIVQSLSKQVDMPLPQITGALQALFGRDRNQKR